MQGVGENLAQASAARFFETARGRVALLSCASTFKPMARAGDPAGEAPGRPGLNALRLVQSIVVSPEMLKHVRLISSALPTDIPVSEDPNKVVLAGTAYKAGDKVGYSFETDARDVADILRMFTGASSSPVFASSRTMVTSLGTGARSRLTTNNRLLIG